MVHLSLLVLGVFIAHLGCIAASPTVVLDRGTFQGATDGTTNKFFGIPFAKPPTGDLRFRLPVPHNPYIGPHTAINFGPACPQQEIKLPPVPDGILDFLGNTTIAPAAEDCLTLNVWAPAGLVPGSKLPVAVWIYGGSFAVGSGSTYDGGVIVNRSIQLGEPVIYVSMNYRVSAFGFLAGKEIKASNIGNFGLHDQRLALRWIQNYISAFGGDPTKVTIWGESAGSLSVGFHMIANGGNAEGLFRGAFMQSGSPIPVGDLSHGQTQYDFIVSQTGCNSASDTLQCLRQLPYTRLKAAVDATPGVFSYQAPALAWFPRVDGVFLQRDPQSLVSQGSIAKIPFITGDCDDEGTLFALPSLNVTTTSQLETYISTYFMPSASSSDLNQLFTLYPSDITQGSPFDTGTSNALTPQFKRIAAILGDLVFQAPRRFLLQQRSGKQNSWVFLSKRLKSTPYLGSVHSSDLGNVYGSGDMTDYLINFVNHLDPNGATGISWPKYTTSSPQMLTFVDNTSQPLVLSSDTYRQEQMSLLTTLLQANPL